MEKWRKSEVQRMNIKDSETSQYSGLWEGLGTEGLQKKWEAEVEPEQILLALDRTRCWAPRMTRGFDRC